MTTTLAPAIPIFRSFDEAKARAFYVNYLGFTWEGEHRFAPHAPLYAFLSRDGFTLHLTEHYGDATPGSAALVHVSDVKAFLQDLRSRGHANANPEIETLPWGKQVKLTDPFGNFLLFLEPD